MDSQQKQPDKASRASTAGLGLTAGLLNGLVALGGGVLVAPVLLAQGIASQVAVGTSLAVVAMLSSVSFAAHFVFGGLVLGALPIAVSVAGGFIGSLVGSKVLARITPSWMLVLFAALQVLVAARLIAQGLGMPMFASTVSVSPPLVAFALLGLFAGTLSGIFGVGGGALVLLGLAAFYGVPVSEGLAIALALNITNALTGIVHHARAGRVLWPKALVLMPAAVIGIAIGAGTAHVLPVDAMRIVFGTFFLGLGCMLARKGWRLARTSD